MKHLIAPALVLFAAACSSSPVDPGWTTLGEPGRPDGGAQEAAEAETVVVQLYDVRDLTVVPSDRPLGIDGLAELIGEHVGEVGITPHENSVLIIHGPARAHRDVALLLGDLRGE